jgi:hypothetical protein
MAYSKAERKSHSGKTASESKKKEERKKRIKSKRPTAGMSKNDERLAEALISGDDRGYNQEQRRQELIIKTRKQLAAAEKKRAAKSREEFNKKTKAEKLAGLTKPKPKPKPVKKPTKPYKPR